MKIRHMALYILVKSALYWWSSRQWVSLDSLRISRAAAQRTDSRAVSSGPAAGHGSGRLAEALGHGIFAPRPALRAVSQHTRGNQAIYRQLHFYGHAMCTLLGLHIYTSVHSCICSLTNTRTPSHGLLTWSGTNWTCCGSIGPTIGVNVWQLWQDK